MKYKCPVCNKPLVKSVEKTIGQYFPFCSERCKLIDLGAWLNADYRIASGQNSDECAEPPDVDILSQDA